MHIYAVSPGPSLIAYDTQSLEVEMAQTQN